MKNLNEIADHIAALLSGKKSRKPAASQQSDDQDADPAADPDAPVPSKAAKFQKSFRKATGGQNEPQ